MTTEIGAKLVLDDHASESLHKIREGLAHVNEKVTEVQHEMGGMLKQALATAVGFQLSGVVDTFKELGAEAFHAATGTQEQVKALAGLVAMTDKTGMSYEDTLKRGEELKNQLEGIGIKAGTSADSVIDAFSMIAERSDKGTEAVAELTNQLAQAGRAVGGTEKLAAAYRDLESGIVRPRNALVMLMRQTGVVSGSAKEVAKGLSAMMAAGGEQKAKAFDLAEKAISKMADKMKDAPLTFKETVEGLRILRENIFEALGGPMVKAITPALENVKKYIQTHKEEIEKFAETMGTKVGVWATEAADKIGEGFKYLKDHADEIEKAIVEGAKTLKEVMTFILAHKEELAIAYGVKTVAPMVGSAVSAVGGIARGGMALGGALAGGGELGAAGVAGAGVTGASAAGAAVALGAFTLAIGSVAAAAWQWSELMDDIDKEKAQDIAAVTDAMKRASLAGDIQGAELFRDKLVMLDSQLAVSANAVVETAHAWNQYNNRLAEAAATTSDMVSEATVAQTIEGFDKAMANHNEAEQQFIAKLMVKNPAMVAAFDEMAATFTDNGQGLVNAIAKIDKELAGQLQKTVDNMSRVTVGTITQTNKAGTAGGLNISQNFSGPISIKQDFRDQDPDRVIVAFKDELGKRGTSRLQANTVGPGY